MNDLMDFLTSTEIIVVYIVVALACLLCFIIYLFDKSYYKRKRRQNTKELNKLVESITDEVDNLEQVDNYYEKPILETVENTILQAENDKAEDVCEKVIEEVKEEKVIEEVKEEKVEDLILENMPDEELEYTDIEPNALEAQEELQKLTEALEKAEEEASKNIDLTTFEEEQELNAIISLDELMSKGREMYEKDLFSQYEDEGNEPISLADLEEQYKKNEISVSLEQVDEKEEIVVPVEKMEPVQEKMILDEFNNIKIDTMEHTTHKFKSSPVISPVFGIERDSNFVPNELELENTANYEKLDEEIKKTNEFLITLRELQSKLD